MFRLVAIRNSADVPDRIRRAETSVIRPKDGAGFPELRRLKQKLRVEHGHVIRVQQHNLLKGAMEDRIGFELPSTEDSCWVTFPDFICIDAFDFERSDEGSHLLIQFL